MSMDHGTMDHGTMSTSPATAIGAAPSTTSTGMVMDHSSMSMGGAKACKISMTWNWNTIDSCKFQTKSENC